jgi:hypothetical protein
MHHGTLTRALAVLGLAACTTPAAISEHAAPPRTAEPSGLGMGSPALLSEHERESGSRFVSSRSSWCDVSIDTHARKLEPTPSFLQAWNLVAARGQQPTRYLSTPPHTEDDARARVCGRAGCTVEQPQIFHATSGGGAGARAGTLRAGFGVMLPSEQGQLVVPVAGVEGTCAIAPELRVERSGSLVHVTAIVHEGDYSRTYFHGEFDERYAHMPVYDGGCMPLSSTRTDIVVDVASARLELVLTQTGRLDRSQPLAEVELRPSGVELRGCGEVLEIAWTG